MTKYKNRVLCGILHNFGMGVFVGCDLEEGHKGDHQCTIMWSKRRVR